MSIHDNSQDSTSKNRWVEPRNAWLTLNRVCNLRCPWCYAQGVKFSKKNDMSLERAISLVELIVSLGVTDITLIGGEPTLWPHLLELNEYISARGLTSGIVTNAYRFGDKEFWASYLEHPNNEVGISIKAWDAKSAASIVRSRHHDQLVIGLKRVIGRIKCGVSFVVNKTCVDHLTDVASFVMGCGAKMLAMNPCVPVINNGKPDSTWVVPHEEIVEKVVIAYPRLVEITEDRLGFEMMLPLCIWPKDFIDTLKRKGQIGTSCQIHFRSAVIFDYEGNVSICNGLFDYPVGQFGRDFTNKETLLSLLNSTEVLEMYDQITSYPCEKCTTCPVWEDCGGGCPMYWTQFNPREIIKGW